MPWWYTTIKSAKFLGISPRDLAPGVPAVLWIEWGLIVRAVDANVESWFRFKAGQDAKFQQLLNGGR